MLLSLEKNSAPNHEINDSCICNIRVVPPPPYLRYNMRYLSSRLPVAIIDLNLLFCLVFLKKC